MMCLDRLGRWFVQIHWLDPLAEEKALLASGVLIEEERMLTGSVTCSDTLAGSVCV